MLKSVEKNAKLTYVPKLNDYVKWVDSQGIVVEGWIYFVDREYITIEIGVKDKPDELVGFHKKTHCCVLCFPQDWNQLEYITSRESVHQDVPIYKVAQIP